MARQLKEGRARGEAHVLGAEAERPAVLLAVVIEPALVAIEDRLRDLAGRVSPRSAAQALK